MSKLSAVATLLPGSALDVHSYPPSVTAECVGWWRVEMMYWQGEFISLVGLSTVTYITYRLHIVRSCHYMLLGFYGYKSLQNISSSESFWFCLFHIILDYFFLSFIVF